MSVLKATIRATYRCGARPQSADNQVQGPEIPRRQQARNYDESGHYIHSLCPVGQRSKVVGPNGVVRYECEHVAPGLREVQVVRGLGQDGPQSASSSAPAQRSERASASSSAALQQPTSTVLQQRRVVLVDVRLQGSACGRESAPAPCTRSCGVGAAWASLQQADAFFRTISGGRAGLLLDRSNVFTATIADTPTLNIPVAVEQQIGNKPGDAFIYLLPENYRRFGISTGLGDTPGTKSWIVKCHAASFVHEIAHNYGFGHAAMMQRGRVTDYGDLSSIMSWSPGPHQVGHRRGLSAAQMFQMGWLPTSAILSVAADGTYQIPNSLSSNQGVRAARIQASPYPIWIEWRAAVNQDADFGRVDFMMGAVVGPADNMRGRMLGSLLVKAFHPKDRTLAMDNISVLLAALAPGASYRAPSGLTITAGSGHSFTVRGVQ
jgi:hypothetical protein